MCLKVEGRKKRPEYVGAVTRAYRAFLDRLREGDATPPSEADTEPLVQIYSRGFTAGMYGGREGRAYVTRTQPDNRGLQIGEVVGSARGELLVERRAEERRLGRVQPRQRRVECTVDVQRNPAPHGRRRDRDSSEGGLIEQRSERA